MLKETFMELLHASNSHQLKEALWTELEQHYSKRSRHYHTLDHLAALLRQLEAIKDRFQDWKVILAALFYHDVIYVASKSDNEEKSAEFAVSRLRSSSFSEAQISRVTALILATKSHEASKDPEFNLFTDADLSILGQAPNLYQRYCEQVRKEYRIYPDVVYKPGRRKVIQHFLDMPRIYKSDYFYDLFERQARVNLNDEFEKLS